MGYYLVSAPFPLRRRKGALINALPQNRKQRSDTAKTKRDLEDAFWQLYAEKSIERITVRELTEKAGYHRGTFYLHYPDVYALLDSEEQELLAHMEECVEKCPEHPSKTDLFALMTRMLALYERNRQQIVILLGEHGDPAFATRLRALMVKMPIWRASDPALKLSPGERELLLEQTASGVLAMIASWLANPRDVSAFQLLHLIYDSAIKRPTNTPNR